MSSINDEKASLFKDAINSFNARAPSRLRRFSFLFHGKGALYRYSSLSEDQIRLLKVRKKNGEVMYDLVHVRFDKAPAYTALSYCWEDQSPDQSLNCGGSTLLVTANIKNFLSYFSTDTGTHYIWIDGVCINQIDIKEKNHQVSFMKSIYTKASNVVIWLGESEEAIDVAIKRIPEVLPLADDYDGSKDGFEDALKAYDIPIRKGKFWKGVEALLSRPWFSRLWTFQEAILPKTVEIRCGSNVLTYDLMTEFIRALSTDGNPLSLFKDRRPSGSASNSQPPGRRTWMRIDQCRGLIADNPNSMLSFSMLLIYGRNLSASKPADKIYGMLGLAKPWMQGLVSVDYSRTYQEVFYDFMKNYLSEGGESRLLNMVDGHTDGLPTWCPNFAVYKRNISIANYLGCTFRAGHPAKKARQPVSGGLLLDKTVNDPKRLGLRGFFLDAISTIVLYPGGSGSSDPPESSIRDDYFTKLIDWEATCLDISRSAYNRLDDTRDAHVRTLTGGSTRKGDPQDDDHELLMSYMMMKYGDESQQKRYRDFKTLSGRQRDHARHLLRTLSSVCYERGFFSTENGRIGLAPGWSRQGDRIAIFYGGLSPFIVRPMKEDPTHYELMGEAYVDGVMYGEALKLEDSQAAETIVLV